jgi:CMP-N-acetylneuraminic acid synthetase
MMDCVTLIPARGGSKGIPGKNIKPLAGKPLIAWTLEAARAVGRLRRVIVSTDDEAIANVARQWGAETPFLRPARLAQDDSTQVDVAEHALGWLEEKQSDRPDYLLLLQPTSPLRTSGDIEQALSLALKQTADAVLGVCEARPHPHLARRIAEDGTLRDFVPQARPCPRRQDLPPAYCVNGAIYLIRREVLLRERTFHPARAYPYVMPQERSLDIDDPWDWRLAEFLLSEAHARTAG